METETLPNERHFANVMAELRGEASPATNGHKATKKVAIIGKAPSSSRLAPYDDESWDIYGLSNGAQKLPRWSRWFELHDLTAGKARWDQLCPEYWPWLATDHGKPLYIQQQHPDLPHAVVYPWDAVFSKFGRYLNNSISLMIAVALLEGVEELGLYGVDMAQTDPSLHDGTPEYQHQRPSCEYMLGIAHGMGVKVTIPVESDLLKSLRVYGYPGEQGEMIRKARARKKELNDRMGGFLERLRHHKEEMTDWQVRAAQFEGRLLQAGEMGAPEELLKRLRIEYDGSKQQYRIHKTAWMEAERVMAKFTGAVEDNDYWMNRIQV